MPTITNSHGLSSPKSNEQLTLEMGLLASQLKFRLSSSPLPVQESSRPTVGCTVGHNLFLVEHNTHAYTQAFIV